MEIFKFLRRKKICSDNHTEVEKLTEVTYIRPFHALMCGTAEDWEARKHKYPDALEPIPAKVYVTRRYV